MGRIKNLIQSVSQSQSQNMQHFGGVLTDIPKYQGPTFPNVTPCTHLFLSNIHHLVRPLLPQQSQVISPLSNLSNPSDQWAKWRSPPHPELSVHPWTGRSLQPLFSDMRPFTLQSDYDYLQNHIISAGLNISRIAQLKVDYDSLDIESELLSEAPLLDPHKIPHETHTKVYLLNPRPEYSIGQKVAIRIDVHDGYGQLLPRGGDLVWVWLYETDKGAAVAANVKDFRNGTYLAEVPVLWIGTIKVGGSILDVVNIFSWYMLLWMFEY
ncbi:nxpe family member 1 [Plakobranchus ocellatus]|uniref:Nxpe family member 1 n=1 Tax=Plakobranchus ocellatus TaxID=259542 RepID=A0AAV4AFW3_9GAST|nr:nxpe family member 1 [Plakobranchus ocellatus]